MLRWAVRWCRRICGFCIGRSSYTRVPIIDERAPEVQLLGAEVTLSRRGWTGLVRSVGVESSTVFMVILVCILIWYYTNESTHMWILIGLCSYALSGSWTSLMHIVDIILGQHRLEARIESNRSRIFSDAVTQFMTGSRIDGGASFSGRISRLSL